MVPELVPPLVRAVDGEEEGLGVRDVDVDGQAVRGARLPHRVEAPVVHLDERPLAAALAEVEAEGLQDLEALRPRPGRLLDGVGLELRVARVRGTRPTIGSVQVWKRPGCARSKAASACSRPLPKPPVRLTTAFTPLRSMTRERVLRGRVESDRVLGGRALATALREGEVRVDVDDREARGRDARLLHVEHGARAEVARGGGARRREGTPARARRASRGDRAQSTHPEGGETAPAVQLHGRTPSSVGTGPGSRAPARVRATADSNSRSHMFRPNITPVAPHSM